MLAIITISVISKFLLYAFVLLEWANVITFLL